MRRLFLCIFIFIVICPAPLLAQGGLDQRVNELSQQITKEMSDNQKTTIAIIEFSDLQGNVTDLGRFLAEELITRLYQTKKFKVIERQLLNKIISEQKLSLTGMVDPKSAKQLGKVLGVDAVASGTITDLAQSLRVNARLISTETGEIFAVASTEVFKDESVTKLISSPAIEKTSFNNTGIKKSSDKPKLGGGLTAGRTIEVSNEIFVEDQNNRIRITSLEFLPDNKLKVHFFCENRTQNIQSVHTPGVKGESYIVDDLGDQYDLIEAEKISNDGRQVPIGGAVRFAVIFRSPPESAKYIIVALRICPPGCGGWAWVTLSFPKIVLQ
jgi:TolB-like protein